MPLASICINNHNYEAYVGEAIDSALAQDYPNVEVIVVDDASSDGSRAVIESYGDRIRTLFVPVNRGQVGAVSAAASLVRGEVVFLLDADDVFYPHKVSRMMALYREHPDAALLYHRLPNANADLSWVGAGKTVRSLSNVKARAMTSHGSWPFQPTSAMAFPRQPFDRIMSMTDTGPAGEVDYVLAMVAPMLGEIVGLDEALGARRLHGENMYTHPDRLAHREWTLRDNIERTCNGLETANLVLERLGESFRYRPERNQWVIRMRHQLGEASHTEMILSRLRMWRCLGPRRALADTVETFRLSNRIRRRMLRRRRRGKPT